MQLNGLLSATLPLHNLPLRKPMAKDGPRNWQDALKPLIVLGV